MINGNLKWHVAQDKHLLALLVVYQPQSRNSLYGLCFSDLLMHRLYTTVRESPCFYPSPFPLVQFAGQKASHFQGQVLILTKLIMEQWDVIVPKGVEDPVLECRYTVGLDARVYIVDY